MIELPETLDYIVRKSIEAESEQVKMINYSIGYRDIYNALSYIILKMYLWTSKSGRPGTPSV